jgi:dTDP-4-amino-4,6-dideoxygalactose transaminase
MGNIEAALLLPQFARLARNLVLRQQLAERYIRALRMIPGIEIPASRPNTVHARHVFPIRVNSMPRDTFIEELQSRRIGCVAHQAVHLSSYYSKRFGYGRGDFPIAEQFGDCTASVPFYPNMPHEHVDIVTNAMAQILTPISTQARGRER